MRALLAACLLLCPARLMAGVVLTIDPLLPFGTLDANNKFPLSGTVTGLDLSTASYVVTPIFQITFTSGSGDR